MSIGSLFSGIGGLELGLESVGLGPVLWQVEKDPYCRQVLAKHWPQAKRYDDIKTVSVSELEHVNLICGGFPCQPHSCAGKQRGTADERWLWGEFARIVRELQPRYVVAENVPGLLSSSKGAAFAEVLGDLATLGYDARWRCVSAAFVGAPHKRERLFVIARHPLGYSGDRRQQGIIGRQQEKISQSGGAKVANPDGTRQLQCARNVSEQRIRTSNSGQATIQRNAESAMGGDADGIPAGLDTHRWPAGPGPQHDHEPSRTVQGKQQHRVARVKALGNAVVPQVAALVGQWLLEEYGE